MSTSRTVSPDVFKRLLTHDVDRAVEVVRSGGLVGMPTETVYGLAADATCPAAVARIFAVKGRPVDHPLIVHLADAEDLDTWAVEVPPYARDLAMSLWPGPLTLILPRSAASGHHVTGGQETVGLRVPSHPVARELLRRGGRALAAPSANRFGRVSPTRAEHVFQELGQVLIPGTDVILDGGDSQVGVESTIVDATGPAPVILRPGAVTAQDLLDAGGVPVPSGPATTQRADGSVRIPGSLASHYAPRARVLLVEDPTAVEPSTTGPASGLLALAEIPTPEGMVRLAAPADSTDYARGLYAALRAADDLGLKRVIAVPPPADGVGTAVRDRLRRAAHNG